MEYCTREGSSRVTLRGGVVGPYRINSVSVQSPSNRPSKLRALKTELIRCESHRHRRDIAILPIRLRTSELQLAPGDAGADISIRAICLRISQPSSKNNNNKPGRATPHNGARLSYSQAYKIIAVSNPSIRGIKHSPFPLLFNMAPSH